MSIITRTNATLWCALLLVAAITACNAEQDEAKPPRTQSDITNSPPPTTNFYTHITASDGKSIPYSKLPSTLIDNELIDVCEQGQVPFLDHCYDAIHLDDRIAGFRLESPTRSFVVAETADTALLSALENKGSYGHGEFTVSSYKHRITFNCKAVAGWCAPPSLLKYGLLVMQVGGGNYIDSLILDTFFAWGYTYQHAWPVKGTLTLNGKVHLLPLTRAQIKRAYGDKMVGNTVRHRYVTTRFTFADNKPENEQVLTGIVYMVNNYARAAALHLDNSAEAVQ